LNDAIAVQPLVNSASDSFNLRQFRHLLILWEPV
jgi:hypothetical protein